MLVVSNVSDVTGMMITTDQHCFQMGGSKHVLLVFIGYTSLYPIPLWEVNSFCFFADSPLVLQAVRPPMACIWRLREPPERNL